MSADALAADPRLPSARRKNPAKLSAQEALILYRMKQIDRGQGCHASVERIGKSVDPLYRDFSVSQTRRHMARLVTGSSAYLAARSPELVSQKVRWGDPG